MQDLLFLLLQSSSLWHNKDSKRDRNHLVPEPCLQLPAGTERNCKSGQHSQPNEVAQSFWKNFFGDMKGTKTFPALSVLDNGILPLQDDAHICSIGLIAAIGIILQVIIGTNNDGGMRNNKMFRLERMEIKDSTDRKSEEDICCFPSGTFPTLFEECGFGSSLYLHVLKAEWYRLFDCIAELQHVTVPQQWNADHLVDCHYETMKLELQTFSWPKTLLLLSNVQESSVTSKAHDQHEHIEGEELEEEGHDHNREEGGGDQRDHEPIANDAVLALPHAGKVWRGGPPSLKYGYGQIYVPDDCCKGRVAKSRYITFVSKSDVEEFRKMWCR